MNRFSITGSPDSSLVFVQELEPLLRFKMTLDIIIFQHADGAINLQHRQRDIFNTVDSMLSQGALDLIQSQVLLGDMGRKQASVVDQQRGRTLDHTSESPVESRQF